MDTIDRQIVRLLRADGRLSLEQIARRVTLSRPAVHQRVKRLEERGVLRGYTAVVDWTALGRPVTAFVWVRATKAGGRTTGRRLMDLRFGDAEIEECHTVAGEWGLVLKVRAAAPSALSEVIEAVHGTPTVEGTLTTIVLSTIGENGLVTDRAGDADESRTDEGAP